MKKYKIFQYLKNSIMASLDIVSLYPSVPYELVEESI